MHITGACDERSRVGPWSTIECMYSHVIRHRLIVGGKTSKRRRRAPRAQTERARFSGYDDAQQRSVAKFQSSEQEEKRNYVGKEIGTMRRRKVGGMKALRWTLL